MLSMSTGGAAFSMNGLLDRLPEREQKIVSELAFHQASGAPEEATAQAVYCLRALEETAAQREQTELRKRIKAAELAGNLMEALQLASELKKGSARRSEGPM
jgi:hypothetical protein